VIENIAIMPPKRKLAPDSSGNLDISAMFKKQGELSMNTSVVELSNLSCCSVSRNIDH